MLSARRLLRAATSLRWRGGIEVAVFGRFKAGKSSFLNHLTGREVLPVGVVPLTAVITRLRFGPIERAEVLEFVRPESRRRWQAEFPLFFYSVRPGHEALRGELMQKLLLPPARHPAEAPAGVAGGLARLVARVPSARVERSLPCAGSAVLRAVAPRRAPPGADAGANAVQ